jgi:hypothetical protein
MKEVLDTERLNAEQAAGMAGYKNVDTFKRYVANGTLPIRRFKSSRKAEPFYSRTDIENHLRKTSLTA